MFWVGFEWLESYFEDYHTMPISTTGYDVPCATYATEKF